MMPGIAVPLYTTRAHASICTENTNASMHAHPRAHTHTSTHAYAHANKEKKKKNRHTQMAGSVKAGESCFSLKWGERGRY